MLPGKPIDRKDDNKAEVPLPRWGWIIIYACCLVLPSVLGVILYFVLGALYYLEIAYAIVGVVIWLAMMFRMRIRDSRNLKKTKSIKEDKTTESYLNYKKSQFLLFVLGGLCLLASVGIFFIGVLITPAP